MKIGIFGGSFNPIHKGHIKIAEFAIEYLNLDKLIFVPNNKSPFKKKENIISGEHRINMLNLVLPKKAKVSDFEIKKGGTSYTIETIKYFKNKYKEDELYLLIGTDNLNKLNKWKNIEEISKLAKLTFFKRSDKFSKINIKKYNGILLKNKIFDYSSSSFKKLNFNNCHDEVRSYIGENFLYVSEILYSMMNGNKARHKHSINAGKAASCYAKLVGVDSKKAWFAGTFHDITKTHPKEWHRKFLKTYGYENLKDFQLHSLSAYYWIKDFYMCKDEEILHAIKVHTNLALDLNPMDKVIYAADKLCQGRAWDGIQKIRNEIIQDFDKGFSSLIKEIFSFLTKERGDLGKEQNNIYERFL